MATMAEVTREMLGPEATEADLAEFMGYVWRLIDRHPWFPIREAIDLVYGDGDYLKAARRLGLLAATE